MVDLKYLESMLTEEAGACLLCEGAPCAKACPQGVEMDRMIRSVRFENIWGAANLLRGPAPCERCESKPCLAACLKGRISRPVAVDRMVAGAAALPKTENTNADLSIDFCGVRCESPFFLSSSVVASNYEMIAKAFDMGWAGAAFKTIGMFVSNEVSPRFDALRKESLPFVGFKNIEQISEHTLEENLMFIRKLKKEYPQKVIIASIMGRNEEEWTKLAALMTEAGADIIECNFSCPHMAADGLGSDVGQDPALVASYTRAVRKGTDLPVLAKMTPNLGNMEPPAISAVQAGATGIAAINTIKSIMNVDLDTFASGPAVEGKTSVGGYSGKAVKPIALRFIQSMKSCAQLAGVPVSGMGGIETWRDAAEFIAMGCTNIQVTTAVMQYGYRIIDDMTEGMKAYLGSHGYKSISEIAGRALPGVIAADDLDRRTICFPRFNRSRCVGCGRCALSCYDGGHQALLQDEGSGYPILDAKKCVGCHLCVTVCPADAISRGIRIPKKSERTSRKKEII